MIVEYYLFNSLCKQASDNRTSINNLCQNISNDKKTYNDLINKVEDNNKLINELYQKTKNEDIKKFYEYISQHEDDKLKIRMILPKDFYTDTTKQYDTADFEVRSFISGDYICTVNLNSLKPILYVNAAIKKIVKLTFPENAAILIKRFTFIRDDADITVSACKILGNDTDDIGEYCRTMDITVDGKRLQGSVHWHFILKKYARPWDINIADEDTSDDYSSDDTEEMEDNGIEENCNSSILPRQRTTKVIRVKTTTLCRNSSIKPLQYTSNL